MARAAVRRRPEDRLALRDPVPNDLEEAAKGQPQRKQEGCTEQVAQDVKQSMAPPSQPADPHPLIIDAYLQREGITIKTHHDVDNLAMAMSLVASTRGVALLPAYAQNFLPWSVISRPLNGEAPTIDLVIGYHKANKSPILRTFLSRVDELIAQTSSVAHRKPKQGAVASPRSR